MLKLWGRLNSVNVQKVVFLLEELGRPYERIDAGMEHGVVGTQGYAAMNPNRLIPTIVDEGFTLWESNSILRYLAATDAARRFFADDARRRADVERWMDWQLSVLTAPLTTMFWGLVRSPGSRSPDEIAAACKKTDSAMSILEERLAGSAWISGASLGLADFALAPYVHRWLEIPGAGAGYANLADYRRRVLDLPSARKALS